MTLMFQPLARYFQFTGRARRSEYWLFVLFQFVVNLIIGFATKVAGSASDILDLISLVFFLALFIPNISVGVRRFHDINQTGWWTILYPVTYMASLVIFIAVKGSSFAKTLQGFDQSALEGGDTAEIMKALGALAPLALWVALPTFVAALITFVMHVLPGTNGQNRFGLAPKGKVTDASVF